MRHEHFDIQQDHRRQYLVISISIWGIKCLELDYLERLTSPMSLDISHQFRTNAGLIHHIFVKLDL